MGEVHSCGDDVAECAAGGLGEAVGIEEKFAVEDDVRPAIGGNPSVARRAGWAPRGARTATPPATLR